MNFELNKTSSFAQQSRKNSTQFGSYPDQPSLFDQSNCEDLSYQSSAVHCDPVPANLSAPSTKVFGKDDGKIPILTEQGLSQTDSYGDIRSELDQEHKTQDFSNPDNCKNPGIQLSSFNMVDIGGKGITRRYAKARGSIFLSPRSLEIIKDKKNPKGDVLSMAEIAGIIAAKDTSKLLPLCHTLQIDKVQIEFELKQSQINVSCEVYCHGKTGVEMEALTGATTALLTIYDLAKAVDPIIEIGSVYLETKIGGKSGIWRHPRYSSHFNTKTNERLEVAQQINGAGKFFAESENQNLQTRITKDIAKPNNEDSGKQCQNIIDSNLNLAATTEYLNERITQNLGHSITPYSINIPWENPSNVDNTVTGEIAEMNVIKKGELKFARVEVGLITMSDRASIGIYPDDSGPILQDFFQGRGAVVKRKAILPDCADQLRNELTTMVESGFDLIAITGGTGLSPKDITPDVLESLATKKWYGFGEAQRMAGAKHTEFAWASRCAAYICQQTLVVLFPGKPKAVTEGLDATGHLIKHALELISKGNKFS